MAALLGQLIGGVQAAGCRFASVPITANDSITFRGECTGRMWACEADE